MSQSTKNYIVCFLALIYLIVRFGFISHIDALGAYASYIMEAVLVVAAYLLIGLKEPARWKWNRIFTILMCISVILGFAIYRLTVLLDIPVPFNLSGGEVLLFLLVVAPLLEEGIFRFFLWAPVEKLSKDPMWPLIAWAGTTLLFSYAHLHAIWSIPADYHGFIYYQTMYTLVLGAACGFAVWKYGSLLGAIGIHFAFNLGFYLGSL